MHLRFLLSGSFAGYNVAVLLLVGITGCMRGSESRIVSTERHALSSGHGHVTILGVGSSSGEQVAQYVYLITEWPSGVALVGAGVETQVPAVDTPWFMRRELFAVRGGDELELDTLEYAIHPGEQRITINQGQFSLKDGTVFVIQAGSGTSAGRIVQTTLERMTVTHAPHQREVERLKELERELEH